MCIWAVMCSLPKGPPFYLVEVGYLPQLVNFSPKESRMGSEHGMHTGVVVGYRFNSSGRYSFSLGFRAGFDSFAIQHRVFTLDETTNLFHYRDTETFTSAVYLGISLIHGFSMVALRWVISGVLLVTMLFFGLRLVIDI